MFVETYCTDPTREDEFNDWYNNLHAADVLQNKGFTNLTRYELIPRVENNVQGKGKYLALWEIETDNLDAVIAEHKNTMRQKEKQGRFSPVAKSISSGFYKQIFTFSQK